MEEFQARGSSQWPVIRFQNRARAPKGRPVKARGETPGTRPHNVLRALKGHTELGGCGHRSPRWGEVSWGEVTQGSAPLHRWAVAVRRVAAEFWELVTGDWKLPLGPAS